MRVPIKDACRSVNIGIFRYYSSGSGKHGGREEVDAAEQERRARLMARGLPKARPLPGVERVLLVCSGKGGVGKTTTAVNVACAVKAVRPELEVGLVDADVFGPSVPLMMNLSDAPPPDTDEQGLILPLRNYGVKCMSMGLLVGAGAPLAWRGLMAAQALARLTRGVAWAPLHLLVVDTPPGTTDTHLSLAQGTRLDGALLVSTGARASLEVTARHLAMLRRLRVPVLGALHNLAEPDEESGAVEAALGVPVLCRVARCAEVAAGGAGEPPAALAHPARPAALAYRALAARLLDLLRDAPAAPSAAPAAPSAAPAAPSAAPAAPSAAPAAPSAAPA